MEVQSLAQLREADERTQRFTPYGLGIDRMLTPESAAEFQQKVIAGLELADAVGEGTREQFDRLRRAAAYGVLFYDIFTLVHDHALLVIEQALRDRFVDFHQGHCVFVDKHGLEHVVTLTQYQDVLDFLKPKSHRSFRLRIGPGPATIAFNGMLNGLRLWARAAGLLRGQRNRGHEAIMATLRNAVAHPTSPHLVTPVDCARMLREVAEFINQLWGAPTPDGLVYAAPAVRDVLFLGWNQHGGTVIGPAEHLTAGLLPPNDIDQFVIVRGYFARDSGPEDPDLHQFDSRYEATRLPSDYLWGPGTLAQATSWLTENQPRPDTIDYLDRLFAIQYHNGQLFLPRKPAIACDLDPSERAGHWYLVRADFPGDAYHHVRALITAANSCSPTGPCEGCPAEAIDYGLLDDLIARNNLTGLITALPPDVRISDALPRSRPIPES